MAEHKLKENEALEILKTVNAADVPQSMEQASALMLEIDAIDRASEELVAAAEARVADIIREFAPQIMAKQQAGHRKVCALYAFARSKRDELTDQGATKTIEIGASGTVKWRLTPDTVDVIDEDAAIAHCKKVGMLELVKT